MLVTSDIRDEIMKIPQVMEMIDEFNSKSDFQVTSKDISIQVAGGMKTGQMFLASESSMYLHGSDKRLLLCMDRIDYKLIYREIKINELLGP